MDSEWQSVSEIVNDFKLSDIANDNIAVLSKLKEKRAELHPDKNGGDFSSEEHQISYHRIDDAITYVERKIEKSKELIPLSLLPTIIDSITTSITKQNKPSVAQLQRDLKSDFHTEISRKYITPKIGSGAFAGISAFLFTKAGDFDNHPVLRSFFQNEMGYTFIGLIFMLSSMFFVFAWVREKREEGLASYLMTDSALKHIFSAVERRMTDARVVTASDIRDALMFEGQYRYKNRPFSRLLSLRPRLSPESIDRILELQLSKLIERKVLEEIDKPGLEKSYKVTNNS